MCNQCDMCWWRAFTNLFSSRRFTVESFRGAIKQKLLPPPAPPRNISDEIKRRAGVGSLFPQIPIWEPRFESLSVLLWGNENGVVLAEFFLTGSRKVLEIEMIQSHF